MSDKQSQNSEEEKLRTSSESETQLNTDSGQNWVEKLRYNKSFVAKLALSEYQVKEYYALLATKLLSFKGMRSRIGWSGVSFIAGRDVVAKFLIKGKTLCLYLAISPDEYADGKYRAKNVSGTKKYEKTPSMFKIKSGGAANYCVKLIDNAASELGLQEKQEPIEPISPKNFPTDTFNNLLTRGLIRLIKTNRRDTEKQGNFYSAAEDEEIDRNEEEEEDEIVEREEENDDYPLPEGIYTDTVKSVDDLVSRYALYGEILDALSSGEATAKLSRKLMLRSIDEMWVSTIEDSLLALDELIRKPKGFIAETEEVLPIEMTKKINGRSIQHLSMHTDYISKVEGDDVTPTKMLNIFREDSLLTYENKFLNTLLSRLYMFVNRRYRAGLAGVDERVTSLDFSDRFVHGEYNGKITVSIELSQKVEGKLDVKNYTYETGLWQRVEKLNNIVNAYMNSSFVKAMGRAYITPPVMRTNAILKNKYFRQCLALWEFIESYEDSGYGLTIDEKTENISAEYIRQIYSGAAMQYLLFRHNATGDYDEENVLSSYVSPILNPRIVEEIEKPSAEDYDIVCKNKETAEDRDILFALDVALKADEKFDYGFDKLFEETEEPLSESEEEEETDEEGDEEVAVTKEGKVRVRKSFRAKMSCTNERTKEYFEDFANYVLSYRRVRMRLSWNYLTLNAGRNKMVRVAVRGKTMYLYLALDPKTVDSSFRFRDVSSVKKYEEYPVMLRVKSGRALKAAKKLADSLAEKYGLRYAKKYPDLVRAADYPEDSFEGLLQKGFIKISGGKLATLADEKLREAAKDIAREIAESGIAIAPADAMATGTPMHYDVADRMIAESEIAVAQGGFGGTVGEGGGIRGVSAGAAQDDLSVRAEMTETEEQPMQEETQKTLSPIETIVRPENLDYSNPEKAGKDDSAGFLQDAIESGEDAPVSAPKKGLFRKIFGSKKNKK